MNSKPEQHDRELLDSVYLYALRTLPANEAAAVEAHLGHCADCRQQVEMLRPIVASFAAWPTDVLRPSTSLWNRLARRIADETGTAALTPLAEFTRKPEWETAAPGISVKILATDHDKQRVSMLVRLEPGTDYPPHRHDGVEELHLLHGELMIDDKKLHPGDYIRAEANTVDHRVWSETGCTCVLLTSFKDEIL